MALNISDIERMKRDMAGPTAEEVARARKLGTTLTTVPGSDIYIPVPRQQMQQQSFSPQTQVPYAPSIYPNSYFSPVSDSGQYFPAQGEAQASQPTASSSVSANTTDALRTAFAERLAGERKKTLGDIQNVYAGRGVTGSGEEATAFGQAGEAFGRATGEFEANLLADVERQRIQQEQFGKQFGLQERQLSQQGQQFGQTLQEQMAQRLQQGGQFGQTLQEQMAQRLQQGGQFGQQFGLQERQLGEQSRQFDINEAFQSKQFQENVRQYGMNYALQEEEQRQAFKNYLLQRGQLTGIYEGEPIKSQQQLYFEQLGLGTKEQKAGIMIQQLAVILPLLKELGKFDVNSKEMAQFMEYIKQLLPNVTNMT